MGRHKKKSSPPAAAAPRMAMPATSGRPVAVGVAALLVVVYVVQFFRSGGLRQEVYHKLWSTYLFIPDVLVADLFDMWVGGAWANFGLLDRVPLLAVAAWIGLTSLLGGALVWPVRLRRQLNWPEFLAFSVGIGLQVLSLLTLLIGLAGWLRATWLMWAVTWLIIVAGAIRLWPDRAALVAVFREGRRPSPWWLIVLPPLLLTLLMAALPPWEFDVREYHLQVPKEWFQQGRITFLPHNVYGNMPLGAEMHALAAMMLMPGDDAWWLGALTGKIVINAYSWLAALAIYAVVRRWAVPLAAWIGAMTFVSTPWVMHASIGHVEGALAACYVLSVAALLRAWPRESNPEEGQVDGQELFPWIALAGFFAGAAATCKYTGVVFVVIPLLLGLLAVMGPMRWRAAVVFLLLAGVASGPWFAKNWVLAGNPTYPLLYRVFGGRAWDEATNDRWREAHGPPRDEHGQRFSWSQLQSSIRDVGWHSDKLSLLLWPLALLGLLYRRGASLRNLILALLAMNLVAWWLLTHRYDRFLVPTFALLAILAGLGAAWASATTVGRRVCAAVVVLIVSLNCIVVGAGALSGDNRLLVALERLRRDEPQLVRTHPAHLWLNDHLPEGKRALLVGEAQVFDLKVPVYYHTCWNTCIFESWLKGKSRDERRQILREHQVSHVFIHWSEIARYQAPGNYGFTDYVTRELVHRELVEEQGLLRPVRVQVGERVLEAASGEVFEVVLDDKTSDRH